MSRFWPLCLVLAAAGCDPPGMPREADRPRTAAEVVSFGRLYGQSCAGCHGARGRTGPAPPLSDPLFLALVSDAELKKILTHGRSGTLMPAFAVVQGGDLTPQQIDILVDGMRKTWGNLPQDEKKGLPPYTAPLGDAGAGKQVFARACAGCHGEDGRHPDLEINDAAFLALVSDQLLRRIVITGRPDLRPGMPDFRSAEGRGPDFKPLTAQEIADVVALLASWRQRSAAGE